MRLVRARPVEGIVEVLAKALQPKNDPLSPFPTELPLTGSTGPSVAKGGGLEHARPVERMAEVLAEALQLKTTL